LRFEVLESDANYAIKAVEKVREVEPIKDLIEECKKNTKGIPIL
jgi:hypothetical protein